MFKSVENFQNFNKEQVDAATHSAAAFSHGVQQLFAETSALSKKNLEASSDAFQTLIASKSLDGALKVQMDFARTSYDNMVSGSSKIGTILSATTQSVFKPLEGIFAQMQGAVRTNPAG